MGWIRSGAMIFIMRCFRCCIRRRSDRGYYGDFGKLSDLHKALKHAYVYDGQYSSYRKSKHGRLAEGLSAHHFVHFDQNHDQVGNRAQGERLEQLCGMDAAKVAIGLVLMAPYVPMLFMGEEFAASTPFQYFADHDDDEMRKAVAEGRKRDFAVFGFGDEVPNPEEIETFRAIEAELERDWRGQACGDAGVDEVADQAAAMHGGVE